MDIPNHLWAKELGCRLCNGAGAEEHGARLEDSACAVARQGKGVGRTSRRREGRDRHSRGVAIDEDAKRFYVKYGFTEMADDPRHLYMAMKTVRRLGLE